MIKNIEEIRELTCGEKGVMAEALIEELSEGRFKHYLKFCLCLSEAIGKSNKAEPSKEQMRIKNIQKEQLGYLIKSDWNSYQKSVELRGIKLSDKHIELLEQITGKEIRKYVN